MNPSPPPPPGGQYLTATLPSGITSSDHVYRWINDADGFRDSFTRASNVWLKNSPTPEYQSDIYGTVDSKVPSMKYSHSALGSGSDMPINGFGQQGMQAGPGVDRNNQQANGMTSNVLATQEPAINYSISRKAWNDTNIPTARRCQNSGIDANLRDNAYRTIYDVNGRAAYPFNPVAFQHGNNQYPNTMMLMEHTSFESHNNNTQACGHSTFQNEMTTGMMSTMGNNSAGINKGGLAGNNSTIPSTLQSTRHASFASDQQNHALYNSNVQAGLISGSAACLISYNQDTSSMALHFRHRQVNNVDGYGHDYGSNGTMAKIPHMQGINGHQDASTFTTQHAVQNYEGHLNVNFHNSMAPTQHVVRNYGHHMPVNYHHNAISQHPSGANRGRLSDVPLNIAATQYDMRHDQGHIPATIYGQMGDRPVLGPVEIDIHDAIASDIMVSEQVVRKDQGHMPATYYGQKGIPYPNQTNTGHYQSNMIPSPTLMPSFPFNGNVVPPTTGAYHGVPFDFGATNPQYDRTFQPDLRNTFANNVRQLRVDVRTFDAGRKLGPVLLGEFGVFCLFHLFPQEIQDTIFECMFPGPRTEHLGLLVHQSYGRCREYRVELPITLFICQRSRYITFLRYIIIERPKQIQNARKIYGFHVTKISGTKGITQPRPLCIGPHDTLAISADIPKWALEQTFEWLEYLDLKIPGGLKSIKHLELRDNHTTSTNFLDDAVALSNVVGLLDFSPLLPSIFTNGILDKFSGLEKLTLTNVAKDGKNRHALNEEEMVFLWYMIADHLDKTTGLGGKRFVETENIEIKKYERVLGKKLGMGK
ncbi:86c782b1-d4e2-43d9-b1c0-3f1f97394647 [Sclerotinia trifoliorum]|uniref:86c782b1-d4e2-43d9-b1c0-3f1f97394647 n=1 Tax=Sclerotinia trifoliorum TaxID=28548 RepID=A0A8H2VVS7_9HELO|nr:86c782b1-d4e2-43d9-b1c0-3f1f97394647 [Sclerotinia trifoliorum]